MSLKITNMILLAHFPGAYELMSQESFTVEIVQIDYPVVLNLLWPSDAIVGQ